MSAPDVGIKLKCQHSIWPIKSKNVLFAEKTHGRTGSAVIAVPQVEIIDFEFGGFLNGRKNVSKMQSSNIMDKRL